MTTEDPISDQEGKEPRSAPEPNHDTAEQNSVTPTDINKETQDQPAAENSWEVQPQTASDTKGSAAEAKIFGEDLPTEKAASENATVPPAQSGTVVANDAEDLHETNSEASAQRSEIMQSQTDTENASQQVLKAAEAHPNTESAAEPTAENTQQNFTEAENPPAEKKSESEEDPLQKMSVEELYSEMKKTAQEENAGTHFGEFNRLKNRALQLINRETAERNEQVTEGEADIDTAPQHPLFLKINALAATFRERYEQYLKNVEANQAKHLEERQQIIEKLKNLYTNTEPGVNIFKEIRTIKEEWKNAGQVAKSEFKLLNNNYFHHLNQFYQMLDMNKEYMEQEYAHNLEKRQHIISRARELETEPAVQKALNELQYLHRLWKEEAEPVAEEHRESTWEEFKAISNRIHERKSELAAQLEEEQAENLKLKNKIIEELRKLSRPEREPSHSYWQNAIKKVEEFRTEFLKIGSVPRKLSNQNWNEFKQHLRDFNSAKNDFYKNLKSSQQENLDKKLKLVETAKANMLSEDWDVIVPLFKKLQDDWKQIGHVPRSLTNKIWDEFREACNTFFNNYREKNVGGSDNWKDNFKHKQQLLEDLRAVSDEPGSVEKIEQIKTAWNNIGKVPREKIGINTEFNKTLREKLKLNQVESYALREEGLSESQVTDKARKIKNQISDLEAEIVKMENNLGFFSNSTRENPLLKDTFARIDEKKEQLENMKKSLHNILSGENQ